MAQTTAQICSQIQTHLDKLSQEHLQVALDFLADLSQQQALAQAYREASQEYDSIWETTVADGLSDEMW
jgi:hypothetical protein